MKQFPTIFETEEQAAIVVRHLTGEASIAELCYEFDLVPSQIYDWAERLFQIDASDFKRPAEQERLRFYYHRTRPVQHAVSRFLRIYRESPRMETLTRHLVGAVLELRFPSLRVNGDSIEATNVIGTRNADFLINDFVFYVRVSPTSAHIKQCVLNLRENKLPVMIVPEGKTYAARVLAQDNQDARGRIDVKSIEAFVAQNIEELSTFSTPDIELRLRELVVKYNERKGKGV